MIICDHGQRSIQHHTRAQNYVLLGARRLNTAAGAPLCVARYKHLAAIPGPDTHGLAKSRLARAKIAMRSGTFVTRSGKTVIKATLALITEACPRTTTISLVESACTASTTKLAITRMKIIVASTAIAATKIGVGTRIRKTLLRLHADYGFGLERLMTIGLNVKNLATITKLGKRHGNAVAPGTAGATNAVRVVFRLHWQTEIEYVTDGWDIK